MVICVENYNGYIMFVVGLWKLLLEITTVKEQTLCGNERRIIAVKPVINQRYNCD